MPPPAPDPSAPAASPPSSQDQQQQQQQQQRQSLRIGKRHDPHDDDLPWARRQTDAGATQPRAPLPLPDPAPERACPAHDAH